jgi:hypothetical protein
MVVVLRYDPRTSTYYTETVTLPGAMDVAIFKDDEFSCTAYLAAKIDADSLRNTVDLGDVNFFYLRGVFFDGEWIAEHRFADTLWTSEVTLAREGRTSYYHVARSITLPFDSYHVAFAFEDQLGLTRALFKGSGDSFRFIESTLEVSDILFQSPRELRVVSFERDGKVLYPNPGRRYRDGQRLGVYFEVYGLDTQRRRSDYDVTFHIYRAPEESESRWAELGSRIVDLAGFGGDNAPAVSQTFRRRGVDHKATEEMLIDVDVLAAGRYELVISVFDRVAGDTTNVSGRFFKIQ